MTEFNNFLKFITGQGTILVRDGKEFCKFLKLLKDHKAEDILGLSAERKTYAFWTHIAIINGRNPKIMCFEYQPGKGISWYNNIKQPTEWYGEAPIVL